MEKFPIGYTAICEQLKLSVLPHYRASYIAKQGRGKTLLTQDREIHIYPKSFALADENDLLAHLEFALKYDGINLEITKAFFEQIEKIAITKYVLKQPTGIYSRKIWYIYEFLLDDRLDIKDCQQLKYVDLLDPKIYFTSHAIKSPRHAINNNLLGNNQFCPFVRRTESLEKNINLRFDEKAKLALAKYDPHLLARACNYLYTKETMSSYQIEREQPDKSRITRFITMLQQAATIESLTKEKLIELQNIVVDPRFRNVDYRFDQNYVGETINPYLQRIHYVSPKPEDVPELMQGLLSSLDRLFDAQVHPVIIAAAISFGFVFIHPFDDGNGRIHRFLIHYVLSKMGFTPKNIVFPISFVMLQNMHDYDKTLESFSRLLLSVLTDYHLSEDGILTVKQKSKSYYQYIDYTIIVEYLFKCIDEVVEKHLVQEVEFLINYDKAKKNIQNVIDMPDQKIDLFIKCLIQNDGKLSDQKRKKLFSFMTDDEILQLTAIVRDTFVSAK
jgi:Fic family protein